MSSMWNRIEDRAGGPMETAGRGLWWVDAPGTCWADVAQTDKESNSSLIT